MSLTRKQVRINNQKENNRKRSEIYKPIQKKLNIYQKELKRDATPSEKLFKKHLESYKIKFKFQKYFYAVNFQCIIDFFIKTGDFKLCIEIDGGYHLTDRQQRKDEYRSDWLREMRNCKIIRFTNDDVFTDINTCLYLLAKCFISNCKLPKSRNYQIFTSIINSYDNTSKCNQPIFG